LVQDESLCFDLKKQSSADNLKILKEVMNQGSNYQINESVSDVLFSYLFSAGYLTTNNLKKKDFKYQLMR
jgi:hypothetical protein